MPKKPKPIKVDVQTATLKAYRSALNDVMGKVGTGPNTSSAQKRNKTRADQKRNAIREDNN